MKKILFILLAATALVACGPNRQELVEQIQDFEYSLFENPVDCADPDVADNLTKLYVTFADKYATDSLTPAYLMKAAEVQANVLHTERAIELLDRIIGNYPDFDDIPMCHFLKGNAYELNSEYEKSKAAYQEFVDKYPNHFMAEQVRMMIPHIGMSPEEMLAEILANASDSIIAQ